MEVKIRRMEDSDLEQVRKILKENFDVYKEDVQSPTCFEFVACSEQEVVGYFILNLITNIVKNEKWFLVEYVAVDKEVQNLGIGTQMMQYAVEFAKKRGVSYIELTSNFTRKAAHRVYEKLGFERRKSYIYRRML